MAYLIDRNKLYNHIKTEINPYGKPFEGTAYEFGNKLMDDLMEMEVVDAKPIVHGKWIDNGIPESMLSKCSVCGFSCGAYIFNFCPNCGARMDGE